MINRIIKLKKQKGAATILTVFFVSLGIAAAFYGTTGLLKGYQESSLTNHSLTQAQSVAWKADSVVNAYLNNLYCGSTSSCSGSTSNLSAVPVGKLNITGLSGVTATVVSNTVGTAGTSGLITVNVQATSGGSTATVQSVHAITASGAASLNNYSFNYGMVVGGNTTLNGAVTVNGTNGQAAPGIGIAGNLVINGGQNLNTIGATGSVSINGNNNINNLYANGNISVTGSYNLGNIAGGGSFTSNGSGTANGSVNGTSSVPSWETSSNTVTGGASVPAIQINIPTVNAYNLKASANYIFDLNNGVPSVFVQNINGLASGWYPIGQSYPDGTNSVVVSQLCKGYSAYNNCISYSGGTWTFSGLGFAPGVLWFNGSVLFNGGPATYNDTVIAMGNITENGNITINAFNTATAANACGVSLYPTNLCTSGKQNGTIVGNTELLAGGYNTAGNWVGGNILLNGSGTNTGNIIAGSTLTANGNITAGGAVLVAGTGVTGGNALVLNGSFAINLAALGSSSTASTVVTGSTAQAGSINLKWARYY